MNAATTLGELGGAKVFDSAGVCWEPKSEEKCLCDVFFLNEDLK